MYSCPFCGMATLLMPYRRRHLKLYSTHNPGGGCAPPDPPAGLRSFLQGNFDFLKNDGSGLKMSCGNLPKTSGDHKKHVIKTFVSNFFDFL